MKLVICDNNTNSLTGENYRTGGLNYEDQIFRRHVGIGYTSRGVFARASGRHGFIHS